MWPPALLFIGGLHRRRHIAVASDGSTHFGGTIDEVAVYNYALPPNRVLVHTCRNQWCKRTFIPLSQPDIDCGRSVLHSNSDAINQRPRERSVRLPITTTAVATMPESITIPEATTQWQFQGFQTNIVATDTTVNLSASYGRRHKDERSEGEGTTAS